MEQITIDIQLDPIKDGIKVPETDVSRPDAHAVILGTNGKIRQISMKEAETILDQMATCGAGTHLGKSDYIAVYNKDKHPNYPLTADYDKKNWFDIEKYLNRKLVLHPNDEYEVFEDGESK